MRHFMAVVRTYAIGGAGAALFSLASAHAQTSGDATHGETVFKTNCAACHSAKVGENKLGPSLAGVVGRVSGTADGAKYSAALKNAKITWTPEDLDAFIKQPSAKVPGTSMPIGVANAKDRADVIAYLGTLSAAK